MDNRNEIKRRTVAPDWESIERDYRMGVLGIREIGRAHGVTHVGILRRASVEGWERVPSNEMLSDLCAEAARIKRAVSLFVEAESLLEQLSVPAQLIVQRTVARAMHDGKPEER